MKRFKQGLITFLLIGVTILFAQGSSQTASNENRPEPSILDESRFLDRNPEISHRISSKITQLANQHGFPIYLYIEPVLIGITAQEKASELMRSWLPDGVGLVVVYESDSRNLGVGQDMIGDPNMNGNPRRVPTYETTAILNRSITSVDVNLASEMYLDAVMNSILSGFDDYFVRRQAPTPPERSVRSILIVIGGVTLLALGVIGAGGLIRHTGMAKGQTFRFPIVDRPERLGAPCGGSVTSRRFAPKKTT